VTAGQWKLPGEQRNGTSLAIPSAGAGSISVFSSNKRGFILVQVDEPHLAYIFNHKPCYSHIRILNYLLEVERPYI
jgi:hypothetical protein